MGRRDKAWMLLDGKPLVQLVLDRLSPQVDWLLISANQSHAAYQERGLRVVSDTPAWSGMGPLAGLASAVSHLPSDVDLLQLMPCDTPLLPMDLVTRLQAQLAANPACQLCYPQTVRGPEPGMLLVRVAVLSTLDDYLQQGGRSLMGWLATLATCTVDFNATEAFANINDLASLRQLEQQLQRRLRCVHSLDTHYDGLL